MTNRNSLINNNDFLVVIFYPTRRSPRSHAPFAQLSRNRPQSYPQLLWIKHKPSAVRAFSGGCGCIA
ncbi:MAG TPA: hypothetical protein VFJ15_12410 [Oleiagrimonas sp.]|nr:hypothetical protein [Oleiagrimonas sp.]